MVAVEAYGAATDSELLPAEMAAAEARKMGERRRHEFATARSCARRALLRLGVPPGPILPGERGAPTWPAGIVGSMTHSRGYVAAAVAPVTAVESLGIDAEPHRPLPDGVVRLVATAADAETLASLPSTVHGDRVLFSAKESVYKWWFPLTRRWLGFREVTLTLRVNGTFTAVLPAGAPVATVDGSWAIRDDLVLTAVATAAQRPS